MYSVQEEEIEYGIEHRQCDEKNHLLMEAGEMGGGRVA